MFRIPRPKAARDKCRKLCRVTLGKEGALGEGSPAAAIKPAAPSSASRSCSLSYLVKGGEDGRAASQCKGGQKGGGGAGTQTCEGHYARPGITTSSKSALFGYRGCTYACIYGFPYKGLLSERARPLSAPVSSMAPSSRSSSLA